MKNKKLLAVFVTLMCIWIAFCTMWGIDMCKEEEKKQIEMTVPVNNYNPKEFIMAYNSMNPEWMIDSIDTSCRVTYFSKNKYSDYQIVYVNDSQIVFDSLGIKIVGYNTK